VSTSANSSISIPLPPIKIITYVVAKINLCGGNNKGSIVGEGDEIGSLHNLGIGARCKDEKGF